MPFTRLTGRADASTYFFHGVKHRPCSVLVSDLVGSYPTTLVVPPPHNTHQTPMVCLTTLHVICDWVSSFIRRDPSSRTRLCGLCDEARCGANPRRDDNTTRDSAEPETDQSSLRHSQHHVSRQDHLGPTRPTQGRLSIFGSCLRISLRG